MRMLLGFFCLAVLSFSACNSQPKNDTQDPDIAVVEPAAAVTEAMPSELSDLKEELQDLEEMLKNHLEQIETSLESADATSKEELVEKKKEVQAWSNKVGLQLQKFGGDMTDDFQSFKSGTQDLFDQIEDYFKEDVEAKE